MKKQIIRALLKHSPQSKDDLTRKLCRKQTDKDILKSSLKNLLKDNIIERIKGGSFKLTKNDCKTGIINILKSGNGFIIENDEKIFVPKRFCKNTLHLDEVSYTTINEEKGLIGRIIQVNKTSLTSLVAYATKINNNFYGLSISYNIPPIILKNTPSFTIKEGALLNLTIINRSNNTLEANIVSIEEENSLNAYTNAIIEEFNLPREYSQEEEEQSKSLQLQKIERKDLSNHLTLTIDPFDAKDFDDAISFSEDEKYYYVYIHIADVAAYLPFNNIFQESIKKRSFTCYFSNKTISLLPKFLTKKCCSLIANENKFAHTVLIKVDKKSGKIQDFERFHSIVKVHQTLNYNEVQKFLDTNKSTWSKNVEQTITSLAKISRLMKNFRFKNENFINLELKEAKLVLNKDNTKVETIAINKSIDAYQIIEEFMLAANTAVAHEFSMKQIPSLYRVHDEPDEEIIQEFSIRVQNLFKIKSGDLSNRKNVNNFLQQITKTPYSDILKLELLRLFKRACYSLKSSLHYGLGKGLYCHFTSPIRRYSDLLIHQQLWALDTKKELFTNKFLNEEALHINQQEYIIDTACRTLDHYFKLNYLEDNLKKYNILKATITSIKRNGLLVFIDDLYIYNFVPFSNLLNDMYLVSKDLSYIKGKKTKKYFACGSKIELTLNSIDRQRKELFLTLN